MVISINKQKRCNAHISFLLLQSILFVWCLTHLYCFFVIIHSGESPSQGGWKNKEQEEWDCHKILPCLRWHTACTPSDRVNRERQSLTSVNIILVINEYDYHNNKETTSVMLNCGTLSWISSHGNSSPVLALKSSNSVYYSCKFVNQHYHQWRLACSAFTVCSNWHVFPSWNHSTSCC